MIVRSVGISDWIILARQRFSGLQEYVVGPKSWDFSLALREAVVGQLFSVREHWHSWIAIEDQHVVGLVSIQPRNSQQVWQVAHLLLAEKASDLTPALLEKLTVASTQHGIERLFLRLPEDCLLRPVAVEAGFEPYLVERLYQWTEHRSSAQDQWVISGTWRSKTKRDDRDVYQLYCDVTPATVRQAEGLSFTEWLQAREKLRGCQEKVWEQATSQIRCWARARPWWDGILLEFLSYPGDEAAFIPLIKGIIRNNRPVYMLIPSYHTQIQCLAEAKGFRKVSEHSLFLKRLLVRVTQTRLMPIRA